MYIYRGEFAEVPVWFFLDVLMWDFDDLANAISLAVLSGAPGVGRGLLDKKTWMKQQRVWETLSIIGLGHLGRSYGKYTKVCLCFSMGNLMIGYDRELKISMVGN